MAIYAGLSPEDALAKWYQLRHATPEQIASLSPEEQEEATAPGEMVRLARENPAAWQLRKTGTAPVQRGGSNTRTVFNPNTGQWDTQDVHGLWSHPETWIQVGAAAGLGGLAAAPLLAGGAGAAGGGAGGGAAFPAIATGPGAAGIAGTSAVPLTLGTGASALAAPTAAAAAGGGGAAGAGAGGASAVTSGASSILPSIAEGPGAMGAAEFGSWTPGLGATVAGSGIGGGGGILKGIQKGAGIAQNLNPVLGKAAENLAANQNTQFDQSLRQQQEARAQQRAALGNTAKANLLRAAPVKAEQGAEGSGYGGRSPALHYTGGAATPFDDSTREAMQPFIDQQIQQLLNPSALSDPNLQPGQSSKGSKILGGLATGVGLYGALFPPKR